MTIITCHHCGIQGDSESLSLPPGHVIGFRWAKNGVPQGEYSLCCRPKKVARKSIGRFVNRELIMLGYSIDEVSCDYFIDAQTKLIDSSFTFVN